MHFKTTHQFLTKLSNDYTYEIALTMVPGLGCHSARQTLDIVDSAKALFELSKKELKDIFGKHEKTIDAIANRTMFSKVEKELTFIEKNKIKVHFFTEPDYPQRLNRPGCEDAPLLVYSLGEADLNPRRAVSIVGTRKATPTGINLTQRLITGFNQENITVVSGLALGIDSASHEAALANNLPTIAVVAHGLDQIYPPQNRQLAKRIVKSNGAILTEMCSGTSITPSLFPVRNRIIAALSDATIVVEASKTGGALITANIASSYHRELFAFPGRIDDKYSEGCNAIIASCKAMLIRNADDVFLNMGWERNIKNVGTQTKLFPELKGDEKTIYNIILSHPEISMDEIRNFCDLSLPKIATALLSLELKNICQCLPGKIYKIL